jgi:hypothetical protein
MILIDEKDAFMKTNIRLDLDANVAFLRTKLAF